MTYFRRESFCGNLFRVNFLYGWTKVVGCLGKKIGKMITFTAFSLRHLVFSEHFQSEIYSMFKQIFLLNAQFTMVCFDVILW